MHEPEIIGTHLTRKPEKNSLFVAGLSVFLMSVATVVFWNDSFGVAKYLPVSKMSLELHGEHWRLLTAVFVHADLEHFLSNMFMLVIFSYLIYGYCGALYYPVVTLGAAMVTNYLTVMDYDPTVRLLGSSGWVYILAGMWLTLYFLVQRNHRILSRAVRMIGISLVLFFPSTFSPKTSYRAHAIGFGLGVALGLMFFYLNKKRVRGAEIRVDIGPTPLTEQEPSETITYH